MTATGYNPRATRLLLFAYASGYVGDILYISMMVMHLQRTTGSTLVAALFPFVRVAAMFASSFVSPTLIGKLPLVRLLTLTRAGETVLLLGLAAAIGLGGDGLGLWVPFLFVLWISFFQGWADPVVYSLVPRLTPPHELARANARLGTAREVGGVAAWGLGGTLAAWLDPAWLLAGCAALFAAGCAASARLPAAPPAIAADGPSASRWTTIRAGWTELFRNPVARTIAAMDLVEGIAVSIFAGAFTLAFVEQRLGEAAPFWGFLNAAYFVGMMLGGLVVARLGDRLNGRLPLALALGSFGYGVGTLLYGATSSSMAALFLVVAIGLPCMLRETAQRTLLQLHVPERTLPNVLVAHGAMISLSFAVSLLLMGFAAETFGIQSIYTIGGVLGLAGAALGLTMFAGRRAASRPTADASSEGGSESWSSDM